MSMMPKMGREGDIVVLIMTSFFRRHFDFPFHSMRNTKNSVYNKKENRQSRFDTERFEKIVIFFFLFLVLYKIS